MRPTMTSAQNRNIIAIIPIPQPHHMGCISQCHSYIRPWAKSAPALSTVTNIRHKASPCIFHSFLSLVCLGPLMHPVRHLFHHPRHLFHHPRHVTHHASHVFHIFALHHPPAPSSSRPSLCAFLPFVPACPSSSPSSCPRPASLHSSSACPLSSACLFSPGPSEGQD